MLAFQFNIPEIFSEALALPTYMVAYAYALTHTLKYVYTALTWLRSSDVFKKLFHDPTIIAIPSFPQ